MPGAGADVGRAHARPRRGRTAPSRTGARRTVRVLVTPPLDFISSSGRGDPLHRRRADRVRLDVASTPTGMTQALRMVVMLRSYSRKMGSTSLDEARRAHRAVSRAGSRDAPLVRRVGVAVQAAPRRWQRCHAAQGRARRRETAGLVERLELATVGCEPTADFEDALGRHGTFRLHPGEQAGAARYVLAADLEHVLEACAVVMQRRVLAPLPSRIRLVATVVPCRTRPTSVAASAAALSTSAMPARRSRAMGRRAWTRS